MPHEPLILRGYQLDVIEVARRLIAQGIRQLIIQASTGAGKTVIGSEIMRACVAKGKRCLFLAPARELVHQCSDKLQRFGVDHGIIMAGHGYSLDKMVQVATKDTLRSRTVMLRRRLEKLSAALTSAEGDWERMAEIAALRAQITRTEGMAIELPPADLVIVDECHLSMAPTWLEILNTYPLAVVIGLSATPARATGRGLGDFYKGMAQAISSSALIEQGYLVKTRVFAPYRPDLKGLRANENGEYEKAGLSARMDKPQLVGDIVEHWKRLADGRRTVVFASGVSHSMHIRDQFLATGIRAEHLDGETPTEERDAILSRVGEGTTTVITNCDVLSKGWDLPICSCCVLAKPTKSYVAYRQMAGRVQRPHPEKKDALLIDHAGLIYVHGFPDADVSWELKESEKIEDKVAKSLKDGQAMKHCPGCHAIFFGPICPACGQKAKPERKPTQTKSDGGHLVEVDRDPSPEQQHENLARAWHKALAICANKGTAARVAAGMFKGDTGKLPWEVPNLPNLPDRSEWQERVCDLFPQYVRHKAAR